VRKQRAISILESLKYNQEQNSPYIDHPDDWEMMDFITVYHKKLGKKDGNEVERAELVWCNTANEAIEEINKINAINGFALDISDEWYQ